MEIKSITPLEKLNYCCLGSEDLKDRILNWQKNKGIDHKETLRAFCDIYTFGNEIIVSPEYAMALKQIHHYNYTVLEHTLHVALYALSDCYKLQDKGQMISTKAVVVSSLCHDLGIIGRYEKFKNNIVCCYIHPLHSLAIAKRLIPNLSGDTQKAIARHMFPLTPVPPISVIGYLLIKADKMCALRECSFYPYISSRSSI